MHYQMDEDAQSMLENARLLATLLSNGADCMACGNEEIPPAQAAAAFGVLAAIINTALQASPIIRK